MKNILLRELKLYFGSLTAYLVICVFLGFTSLLLWVFPGYQNILDTEYAQLDGLFANAPWLFLWLIPALCMHLFAEVYRSGKSIMLFTRPVSSLDIILGKYIAAFIVVLFSIMLTLVFFFSIYLLANPVGNVDTGGIIGSYVGLVLLASSYLSISLFASTLSNSQPVVFVIAVVICIFFYNGLEYLSSIISSYSFQNIMISLSIKEHYWSLSRGVINSEDLIFFIIINAFFLILTQFVILKKR